MALSAKSAHVNHQSVIKTRASEPGAGAGAGAGSRKVFGAIQSEPEPLKNPRFRLRRYFKNLFPQYVFVTCVIYFFAGIFIKICLRLKTFLFLFLFYLLITIKLKLFPTRRRAARGYGNAKNIRWRGAASISS